MLTIPQDLCVQSRGNHLPIAIKENSFDPFCEDLPRSGQGRKSRVGYGLLTFIKCQTNLRIFVVLEKLKKPIQVQPSIVSPPLYHLFRHFLTLHLPRRPPCAPLLLLAYRAADATHS